MEIEKAHDRQHWKFEKKFFFYRDEDEIVQYYRVETVENATRGWGFFRGINETSTELNRLYFTTNMQYTGGYYEVSLTIFDSPAAYSHRLEVQRESESVPRTFDPRSPLSNVLCGSLCDVPSVMRIAPKFRTWIATADRNNRASWRHPTGCPRANYSRSYNIYLALLLRIDQRALIFIHFLCRPRHLLLCKI